MKRQSRRLLALLLLLPVLALHIYLVVLGGPWRTFALIDAGFGISPTPAPRYQEARLICRLTCPNFVRMR
jgi:hypothetical protein